MIEWIETNPEDVNVIDGEGLIGEAGASNLRACDWIPSSNAEIRPEGDEWLDELCSAPIDLTVETSSPRPRKRCNEV